MPEEQNTKENKNDDEFNISGFTNDDDHFDGHQDEELDPKTQLMKTVNHHNGMKKYDARCYVLILNVCLWLWFVFVTFYSSMMVGVQFDLLDFIIFSVLWFIPLLAVWGASTNRVWPIIPSFLFSFFFALIGFIAVLHDPIKGIFVGGFGTVLFLAMWAYIKQRPLWGANDIIYQPLYTDVELAEPQPS